MPAPKYSIQLIEDALDRLREGDHPRRAFAVNQGLNDDAVRIYLDSWVRPALSDALAILKGDESVADVKFRRYDR